MVLAVGMVAAGHGPEAIAQTSDTVSIAVDATSAGTPLERIWPFYGYDEVNNTTTPPGQDLLRTLGSIDPVAPHIRTHFLLNTGDATAADIEALGEEVRARVQAMSGVSLHWEIRRIGIPGARS
jgi:hypothetical protein